MYIVRMISFVLVIIGALNWALVGMFGYDLVASIFGDMTLMTRIIYSLVGIAAVSLLLFGRNEMLEKDCHCECG